MRGSTPLHDWWTSPALLVGVALAVRLALAFVVQGYVDRKGTLCVFGDTDIYWRLAGAIERGETYQVDQSGQPHFALRTPGYPLFLAACRRLFGDRMGTVRLVQAVLNALSVLLVVAFTRLVLGWNEPGSKSAGCFAGWLAALDPYVAGMSVLALSEGPFLPLMTAGMVGLAKLWGRTNEPTEQGSIWSVGTGLAMGLAIQTRPSWALFVPLLLLAWVMARGRSALRNAAIVALTVGLVMAPWWYRNFQVFGRFVPTAVWVGASLYDGIRPGANGASDMRFLEAPDVVALDETDQDIELRRRSVEFARSNPSEVSRLAVVKAGRYFSPWPNADSLRSVPAAVLSACWTLPTFALVLVGAWSLRRDARALVLTLGPLLYFLALHMVFVSSIRYRIPGMLPAFCCAGAALVRLQRRWRTDDVEP